MEALTARDLGPAVALEPVAIAVALADAAFDAWLEVEGRGDRHDKVGMGAGGNPTSKADAALEKAILDKAEELGITVLSEEAGLVDNGSDWIAVVDPLDGSRNAGRGIPFHCTSVAVGRRGAKAGLRSLQAGVVQNLVTADTYVARKGKGATVNGEPAGTRTFDPEEVLVGLIADYTTTEIDEAHQRPQHHIRDLGSAALEMCLVGTGAMDAFVVRRPWLRVIDIAAASLFVRECGGVVLEPSTLKDLDTPFNLDVRTGILAAHDRKALEAVQGPKPQAAGKAAAGTAVSRPGRGPVPAVGLRLPSHDRKVWALVGKADIPHVLKQAQWLRDYLREKGQEVLLESSLASAEHETGYTLEELDRKADLFMTVGGDGTILMVLGATDKPVFGVNAGAIGFMSEAEPPMAKLGIDQVIAGQYRIEERDRLACWLDGERLPDATNEVTLQTARIAKLIQFRIAVGGEHLDTLRGDGIIVSTATGSTGYAMSVGGPLVHPAVRGTVLAPIAPFRLAARPWVVPGDAEIEVTLLGRDSLQDEKQARVVVDGQHGFGVAPGSTVRIAPSDRKARFVRLGSGFYERVRTKLMR